MPGTFSTAQKLSLAGMFIGAVMCLIGLGAPYWLVTDISVDGVHVSDNFIGANLGVFMVCGRYLGQEQCKMLPMDDDSNFMYAVRVCGSVCVLVGGICGLAALCLACCGRGSRFVILGVICFIAAAIGAVAPGVFANNFDVFTVTIMGSHVLSYGWAFYLFSGGVAVLGVVSIMACFAAPENPIGGLVLSHVQSGPSVIVAQSHTHMGHHPYHQLHEPRTMTTAVSAPGVSVVNSSTTY